MMMVNPKGKITKRCLWVKFLLALWERECNDVGSGGGDGEALIVMMNAK